MTVLPRSVPPIQHPSELTLDKHRPFYIVKLYAYGATRFYSYKDFNQIKFLDLKSVDYDDVELFIRRHLEKYAPMNEWRVVCENEDDVFVYTAYRHVTRKDINDMKDGD